MIRFAKNFIHLIKETLVLFRQHNLFRHSAGLAFFTIFSMAPVSIILITVAGNFMGEAETRDALFLQVEQIAGIESRKQVETIVNGIQKNQGDNRAAIFGIATLIFGATGAFFHLKDSINTLWGVRAKRRKFFKLLKDRIISFSMIFVVGILLAASFAVQTLLYAINHWLTDLLPNVSFYAYLSSDIFATLLITSLLFAFIFYFLPDAVIRFRDAAVGAMFTAVLFILGQSLIGWYIGSSNIATAYGAAGSIIILLLWVFYSAIMLFFGAGFTWVYCKKIGVEIQPKAHASWMKSNSKSALKVRERVGAALGLKKKTDLISKKGTEEPDE